MATNKQKPKPKVKAGTSKEATVARKALFVEAYIANGGNGSEAAIAAGYSAVSSRAIASKLLTEHNIQEEIRARQVQLADKFALNTENVILSLARAVHFDPRKLYNADGSLKRVTELDDDTAAALAGVEVVEMNGENGSVPMFTKKVKWLDKNTAREQAMKHLGLFKEDNEQRNGAVSGLPREMMKMIVERLRELKQPAVAGKPAARGKSSPSR